MNWRYFLRLVALSSTTVFGIWFLAEALALALIFFSNDYRFSMFITRFDLIETGLLASGAPAQEACT
jgi:hypothetical protein